MQPYNSIVRPYSSTKWRSELQAEYKNRHPAYTVLNWACLPEHMIRAKTECSHISIRLHTNRLTPKITLEKSSQNKISTPEVSNMHASSRVKHPWSYGSVNIGTCVSQVLEVSNKLVSESKI
jgi:hypothetical protein